MILQRFHMSRLKKKQIGVGSGFPVHGGISREDGKATEARVELQFEGVDDENERFRVVMDPDEAIQYGHSLVELGKKYKKELEADPRGMKGVEQ